MDTTPTDRTVTLLQKLGPGLLLAAASIGASHLVLSPRAGSMFGLQLLWLVTLTHLFKYHAFEFGPRYAAATGESLIAGYMRLGGPKGWALWIYLATTIAQGIGVLAGVVGIAAAVLCTFIGKGSLGFYTVIVIVSVLSFLLLGGYRWLDGLNKIIMVLLLVATVVVFVPELPSPRTFVYFVTPSLPRGPAAYALIAAILGWMPTGIDVSLWHSMWTLEKNPDLASLAGGEDDYRRRSRILGFALADMRIGYGLSFVVASVFLILGAMFLTGVGKEVGGIGFARSLASIYADKIAPWMSCAFLIAAFTAMYSTTYTVMDGFSRSFSVTLATLLPAMSRTLRRRLYMAFLLTTSVLAFVIVVTIGEPVKLVMIVAAFSMCVAPLFYALNYYCVTRLIADVRLRPGPVARWLALGGVLMMLLATLFYMWYVLFVPK